MGHRSNHKTKTTKKPNKCWAFLGVTYDNVTGLTGMYLDLGYHTICLKYGIGDKC